MRYIGLDVATTTGWTFFEDGRLIEKNSIVLPSQMDLPQRLNYFHIELSNILNRLQPEWIFIEDVILAISGAKTLAYLARLNGVAISTAFSVLRENVKLYTPNYWKSNSFPGLSGMAKKWQIQIAAVKHLNIPIVGDFSQIDNLIIERDKEIADIKNMIDSSRVNIYKLRSSLVRKRNVVTNRDEVMNELKIYNDAHVNSKKILKSKLNEYDRKFNKVSIDIAAQTGVSENIADACGIALCGYKEINSATN